MATPKRYGKELSVTANSADFKDTKVAALANGKFVVVWTDTSSGDRDVKLQVYNADGSKAGSAQTVAGGAGAQQHAAVGALPDGRFVVAYEEHNPAAGEAGIDVVTRTFSADGMSGSAAFDFGKFTYTEDYISPAIAVSATGGFAVTFQTTFYSFPDTDILGYTFGPDGAASLFTLGSDSDNQSDGAITPLSNGAYAALWTDEGVSGKGSNDGSGTLIRGSVGADGGSLTDAAARQINSTSAGDQIETAVAGLSNGTFVAVWTSFANGNYDVLMRRFNNNGTSIVDSEKAVSDFVSAGEGGASVTAVGNGFVVAWHDTGSPGEGDGSGLHIRARMYDANGVATTDEFQVNSGAVAGDQRWPSVTLLKDGRLAFTWVSVQDTSVQAAIFDPRTSGVTLTGTAVADDWVGSKFNDAMAGNGGNDSLVGAGGNDKLRGGDGADLILGDSGDDSLKGEAGADRIFGGSGSDKLSGGGGDFKDVFVFAARADTTKLKTTWDRIYDFDAKEKGEKIWDRIDLSGLDTDGKKGDQKFRWEGDAFDKPGKKQPDGQIIVDTSGKGVKVLLDYNGDGKTDDVIQVLKVDELHRADFVL